MDWAGRKFEKTTTGSHGVDIMAVEREIDTQASDGAKMTLVWRTGGSKKGTRTFHGPKAKAGRRRAS